MGIKQKVELRLVLTEIEAQKLRRLVESQANALVLVQQDVYYDTPLRSWSSKDPVTSWLRVRAVGMRGQINLKTFTFSAEGITTGAHEIEFEVSSVGDASAFLRRLGYVELVTVHKVRVSAQYKGVEIALDEVADLGSFAEFEALNSDLPYDETLSELTAFVQFLGIEVRNVDRRGYPYALLRRGKLI